MSKRIIEHFIALTAIPHCSGESERLKNFLLQFAENLGYEVEVDAVNNILIKKGNPRLALQAHYDMVCMGKAPKIDTYIESGWMGAKESSLGADNGIAIAMMMLLMEQGEELEFLLTSDEEIGLVGASAIDLKLNASYMLNLDYEDEAIVCIGCAGGADLLAERLFDPAESSSMYNYEVSVTELSGGHSGVEIHKDIPNAIKILADYLKDKEVFIASAKGGERRNSIPANMVVELSSKVPLKGTNRVEVKQLDRDLKVYKSDDLIDLLFSFKHGVDQYNEAFQLPDTSINLAIVNFSEGVAKIECSSRAMSDKGLEEINEKYQKLFEAYGFNASIAYKYPSWKPEVNSFTALVNDSMSKVFGKSQYEAIHAGLECGVLLEKYPDIKFASIGPTIVSPHSTNEKLKLDSVEKIFQVVEKIIKEID